MLFLEASPMGGWFYLFNAILLVFLLLLSGLISGSEIALFSLNSEDVQECREKGNRAEQKAVRLLEKPQYLLATILIFNNLVNITIVTISTFLTWELMGTKNPEGLVIVILTGVVTLMILFFGELLPKVYAAQYGRSFIRNAVFLIDYAYWFFKPLSRILVSLSNVVEKRIERKGYKIHIDELPEFIDEMPILGQNADKEKEILKGIVNFSSTTVQEIMTTRHEITALDVDMPLHELIEKVRECGYSRIPVYAETIDRIIGILYAKDLLPLLEMPNNFKWTKLLRASYPVPKNKKIDKLLRDFQEKHVHMAIVVDEYGGTIGLVTLEDIIEEIVGDINDEFDDNVDPVLFTRLDEQSFLFEGKILINDFCKVLEVDPDFFDEVRGESKSLGGLMLELFSRFPKLNEETTFGPFLFTIMSVGKKKIKVVKVKVLNENEIKIKN
ncbi:MAG: gliding motility-associated protein GldE [Microscillaceae bacterium]